MNQLKQNLNTVPKWCHCAKGYCDQLQFCACADFDHASHANQSRVHFTNSQCSPFYPLTDSARIIHNVTITSPKRYNLDLKFSIDFDNFEFLDFSSYTSRAADTRTFTFIKHHINSFIAQIISKSKINTFKIPC